MNKNPARRLGAGNGDADEVKKHPYFTDIDWEKVFAKDCTPPLIPTIVIDHIIAERCHRCFELR